MSVPTLQCFVVYDGVVDWFRSNGCKQCKARNPQVHLALLHVATHPATWINHTWIQTWRTPIYSLTGIYSCLVVQADKGVAAQMKAGQWRVSQVQLTTAQHQEHQCALELTNTRILSVTRIFAWGSGGVANTNDQRAISVNVSSSRSKSRFKKNRAQDL